MPSARALALRVLQRWNASPGTAYAERFINDEADRHSLPTRDRAQLNALVLGTLRNRSLLDFWLSRFLSSGKPAKLKPDLHRLLQLALFDLLIHNAAPHAAVSEAVSLAPKSLRPLANAVLRRAGRERSQLPVPAPLHIRFSHPGFLVAQWSARYGEAATEKLLTWNNTPPEIHHRLNRLHPDNPPGPVEFTTPAPDPLADGRHYAQDPSTTHAPILLNPQPGEHVLDACAAPGGKTALLAELMQNTGQVIATDASPRRLKTLTENLHRLHVTNARVLKHDWATSPCPQLGEFDAILLDVPCSNTGVFRRRVDARWRITPESIAALTDLQLAITTNAITHLKPGGRLVYSTCSIEPAENLDLVHAILEKHPHLTLAATRESLPHADATDGAFAALLTA